MSLRLGLCRACQFRQGCGLVFRPLLSTAAVLRFLGHNPRHKRASTRGTVGNKPLVGTVHQALNALASSQASDVNDPFT